MARGTPSEDPRKPPIGKLRPNPGPNGPGRASPDDGIAARTAEKRREAEQFLARKDFAAAAPILQTLAKLPHESTRDVAAWARQQLQRVKQREIESGEETDAVCRLARKLIAQNDYAETVRALSDIPEGQATEESRSLLEMARETIEELDHLRTDIEAAINVRRYDDARKLVDRFLDLKPGDRRVQDIYEQLHTYGEGGPVRGLRRDRSYGASEGFGLFSAAGMEYAVMGLAFLGGTIAITMYLRDDRKTIQVEVDDAAKSKDVGLGIADAHYTVDSFGGSVLLPPGHHTVSLTVARVEVTSLDVTVEKGKSPPKLAVAMEGGEPSLRLVAASAPSTSGGDATTGAASQPATTQPSSQTVVAATTTPGQATPTTTPVTPARSRPPEKPFELPAGAPPEAQLLFKLYQKIPPNTQPLGFQVKLKVAERNPYRNVSRVTDIPVEGFDVALVSLPDTAGFDAADVALFNDSPALRTVTLFGPGWTGDEISGLAGHAGIEYFNMPIGRQLNPDLVRPCKAIPHLTGMPALRGVSLEGVSLTDDDLKLLGTCRKLDSISLNADGLTAAGLSALSDLPELRNLTLRWTMPDSTGPSDDDLAFLKGMPKLSQLTLSHCPELTGAGFQRAGKLPDLRGVFFIDCPRIDDDGVKALAIAAANLQSLSLNAGAAQTGTESAVTSKGLAGLRPLKSLQSLTIHSAKEIVDFGIGIVTSLPSLRSLDLTGAGLTDMGMDAIAKHKGLTGLNLTRVQIGDEGCANLARMTQLQNLTLDQTEISDEGLTKLQALKQLRWLSIMQTNTSKEAAGELRDSVGKLRIQGP